MVKMIKYAITIASMITVALGAVAAGGTRLNTQQETSVSIPAQPISGQVLYQERVTLPPQALLNVQIIDITEPNSPYKVVTQTDFAVDHQSPIPFVLPLNIEDLKNDHLYALQARISVGDALWFTNTKPLPVVKEREGYLIHLERVGMVNFSRQEQLTKTQWLLENIEGKEAIDPYPTLKIETIEKASEDKAVLPAFTNDTRYQISGTGGCNHYFATALLNKEKQSLSFSSIGMTFMACADTIMSQESHFVDMLPRVKSYQFEEGGYLYFLDMNGTVLAYFKGSHQ